MICDEFETVAHCMKNGCVPKQSAQLDLPDFIAGALGVSRGTAYDMMREALAEESSGTEQPAQQAPVAWQVEMFIAGEWAPLGNPQRSKTKAEALASNPALPKEHQRLFPVYTSPPAQRKPLTDEQIMAIGKELGLKCRLGGNPNIDFDYARAIEAAHGIKENT